MNTYGAIETNSLENAQAIHAIYANADTVAWTEKGLKIVRLRLLSDPGYPAWDVSYCYGRLANGTPVKVDLPFSQLPKRNMRAAIVKYAQRDRVFALGLGIFENLSTLN